MAFNINKKEAQTYGGLFLVIALAVFIGGIGLTAVRDRHTVTVHAGYTIYTADDDTLAPNPLDLQGEYYYVKGYWDKPKKTLNDVYAYAERLAGEEPTYTPDHPEDDADEPVVKTAKVHFTVQKKITTHESPTHRTKEYIPLSGINVHIHRDNDKQLFKTGQTNSDGVISFTVPLGVYDYNVVTDDYSKSNTNNQEWTTEGEIYYKKITLITEEIYADGYVEDTTPVAENPDPVGDDDGFTGDLDEGVDPVPPLPDDDGDRSTEWKAPWVEGGGQAQLEGSYDDYDVQYNYITIAVGVFAITGTLMLVYAQFMTKKR